MKKAIVILISTVFVLTGCETYSYMYAPNRVMDVQIGMTRQDVYAIYGEPKNRSLTQDSEEWKYRYYADTDGYDVISIRFVDDVVEKVESYYMSRHRPESKYRNSSKPVEGTNQ